MRKKILILSILFIAFLAIGNVRALENGVTIPLVADRMSDKGEEGSYLNAQVIVANGTGHVFVDTNPYTQVDLQGSARIAASVASDVLGVDEKSYDFYYIIEIDSPIIGGPSAGGALTVATIAAMKNWTIKPDIAMTGMIDPDESIGPVGGIPFKLEAAAAAKTKLFLVPQGQLIVDTTNLTDIGSEHFLTGLIKKDTVNLKDLGKKLNVDVEEVGTIQDAVLEFTGHDISKPSSNKTVYTSNYLKLLQPLAMRLENESKNMYNDSSFIGDNNLIKNAKILQNRADNLTNDEKYYAATSLYFESMINILTAQWDYQYSQEKDKKQFIANITKTAQMQIQSSENDLDKIKSGGVSDVEVIGAAESRIEQANDTLENVKALNNPNDIISGLAFAYERARTAQWWLTLATPSGKIIPEEILKERSGWYLGQAQSISAYVQALISETGNTLNIGDTNSIQKEIERGYYSGAIFDSLQIISRLGTVIELSGLQDPSTRINQSASSAQSAINEARSNNIEPTLAVSSYEYGGILTDPFGEKSQYSYAKTVVKVTESLYSHAVASNQSVMKPGIEVTNGVPNITPGQTMKSPAFDVITLLLVIFSIRKLRKLKK